MRSRELFLDAGAAPPLFLYAQGRRRASTACRGPGPESCAPQSLLRIMRTQGGALVRVGSPGVGAGRLLHRPSPRRRRRMGPGL